MKKIIFVCLIFLLSINFVMPVNANTTKTLKIGITDFVPMNYYDESGELIGFDTELAKYVCEELNMIPQFVHIDWSLKEFELESGNVDCVWNGLTLTDERLKNLDCSYPYAKASYIIVSQKANINKFKTLDLIMEQKFAVEEGSISEMEADYYGLSYISTSSEVAAMQAVQDGIADACIVDSLIANKLLNNKNSFFDLGIVHTLYEEKFVIGFKKDSQYTKKVNEILSLAKEKGILNELSSKYNIDLCLEDIPSITKTEVFKDVSLQHWAYDYISEMSKKGVISGYGNGMFGPEDKITRAQFATMLCRIANIKTDDIVVTSFSDVSMADWYAVYVEAAKPYFGGYNNNTYYNPNTYAKREDIAVALVKYKGYDISLYSEEEFEKIFTDWNEISVDARKYVYAAVKNNLINGYNDDTFRGEANITRAEAATLFYKASK